MFKLTIFLIFSEIILTVYSQTGIELLLIQQAGEYLAPFSNTARDRLHDNIFGSGRAARSTDVAVINTTDKKFKLQENECETGGWTGTLFPEYIIEPHKSVVYGAESFGFMTGLAECVVKYKSTDGQASFELSTSNPYFGPVEANGNGQGVHIKTILGRGSNNLVRFILE